MGLWQLNKAEECHRGLSLNNQQVSESKTKHTHLYGVVAAFAYAFAYKWHMMCRLGYCKVCRFTRVRVHNFTRVLCADPPVINYSFNFRKVN